jgi:hypothetical protein
MEKKIMLEALEKFRKDVEHDKITNLALLGTTEDSVVINVATNGLGLVAMESYFNQFLDEQEQTLGDTDDE